MVNIPRLTNATESLRPRFQQNVNVRVSAESFGAAIGRGMQDLAQGIGDVGQALALRDKLKGEADARNALNQYRDILREGMYNPETGYMNQTGANALEDRRARFAENMQSQRSQLAQRLSPAALQVFDEKADALDNTMKDSTIRHEAGQMREYTIGAFEASAQGYLDDAILNYSSDEKFQANFDAAMTEMLEASALLGDSKPQRDEKIRQLTSSATVGRVYALGRTDPIAAFDYLQDHKEAIDPAEYDKAFRGLEPVYYQAAAREWIGKTNVAAEQNGRKDQYGNVVDKNGLPSFIVGPESSGNDFAANSESTALGPVQFIKDTWLRYVDKVQPDWAVGQTEEAILAFRTDRKKVGEIYQVFRKDNQAFLKSVGADVTPRNEYVIHHMGPAVTEALLKAEAGGQAGQSLKSLLVETLGSMDEANTWVAKNPWMKGQTVAGAMRWFAGKTSTAPGDLIAPTDALTAAADIQNPKMREAVLKELELRIKIEKMQRDETQRQADEAAWEIIDNGGQPADIPPELQVQAGVATMNQIFDAYERSAIGVDTNDEERHLELLDLAVEDPEAFANLELNDERGSLSRSVLLSLKEEQQKVRADMKVAAEGGNSALVYEDVDYRQAMEDAKEQYQAAVGIAPGANMSAEQMARYNRFTQQLRGAMRSYADIYKRPMTFEERSNAINTLLAPVVIDGVNDGWFGSDRSLFEVPSQRRGAAGFELQLGYEDVDPADEVRIRDQLTKALKREPTEDEVVESYENDLLISMGIEPSFDFDDIPSETRKQLIKENPGMSRLEIVDLARQVFIEAARRIRVE